jgi:hypothetical protein
MSENMNLSPELNVSDLESNATWSVRYLDPSGFECLLSLDAGSGLDVLKKGQRALERLLEGDCTPVVHKAAETIQQEKENADEAICPLHHMPMKQWQKNGRKWYAHKTAEGQWCKGK